MLDEGRLSTTLPALRRAIRIGAGQSVGGCLTIVMQGRHRCFDAVAILGFSGIRTIPPLKDPQKRQALIAATAALNRHTDVSALSIPERTSAHTNDDMTYSHHWEDVPADILAADTPPGYAFRRDANWPPAWRSATLPPCALIMMSPGCVSQEAAAASGMGRTYSETDKRCPDGTDFPVWPSNGETRSPPQAGLGLVDPDGADDVLMGDRQRRQGNQRDGDVVDGVSIVALRACAGRHVPSCQTSSVHCFEGASYCTLADG